MRRLLLPILILAAVASACSFTVGSKTPSATTSPGLDAEHDTDPGRPTNRSRRSCNASFPPSST